MLIILSLLIYTLILVQQDLQLSPENLEFVLFSWFTENFLGLQKTARFIMKGLETNASFVAKAVPAKHFTAIIVPSSNVFCE